LAQLAKWKKVADASLPFTGAKPGAQGNEAEEIPFTNRKISALFERFVPRGVEEIA
jgi:hypothetical protein